MSDIENTISVAPSRLKSGSWCHASNQQKGEGDISASYSADVIAMEGRVRKPFRLNGYLCVCVGKSYHPQAGAKIYKLIELQNFEGTPTSYNERCKEEARACPNGFYHGMRVKNGKQTYVLSGPAIMAIESDEPELVQASLF